MTSNKKKRPGNSRPTKYTKKTIDTILNGIRNNQGKTRAVKNAGIDYSTFCDWVNKKPDFSNAVKKAEEEALMAGKDYAIMAIFNAMENQWQAAAWWLERNFKEQYSLKNNDEQFDEILNEIREYRNSIEREK